MISGNNLIPITQGNSGVAKRRETQFESGVGQGIKHNTAMSSQFETVITQFMVVANLTMLMMTMTMLMMKMAMMILLLLLATMTMTKVINVGC